MKGTVRREALLGVLSKVKAGVGKTEVGHASEKLLLEGKQGKLTLTASNGEVFVVGSCKATLNSGGAICVPSQGLESFLKVARVDTVSLNVKSQVRTEQVQCGSSGHPDYTPEYRPAKIYHGELKVQAGLAATSLAGANPKNFPKLPKPPQSDPIRVMDLAQGLQKVDHAIATDDARPVFASVCINPGKKSGVELVASDGWRLTVASVKTRGQLKKQILVPRSAALLLMKLMPSKVSLRVANNHAFFEGDGVNVTVVCTKGTYPNYQQLIPTGGNPLRFQAGDLMTAIKTVEAMGPDGGIIRLQTKGKTLRVSGRTNGNETECKLPCGGKANIAFNIRYLRELVARMSGPVTMRTTTAEGVAIIKQNGTTHLLMPMVTS